MNVAGHNRRNIPGGAVLVALLLAMSIPARAAVTVGPRSVSFGNQVVGTTRAAVTVTLTNSNIGKVTITSVSVSLAQFSYSGPSRPLTLRSGQRLTGTVKFSSTAPRAYSGILTFTRANGSKRTATLRGIGLQTARLPPSFTTPSISRVVVVGQTAAFLVEAADTGLRPGQPNLDSVRCPSPPRCRNQLS